MMRDSSTSQSAPDEFVEFFPTGQSAKGEYHCSECGYGIASVRALPVCPMCGGTSWEQSAWSPFSRTPL